MPQWRCYHNVATEPETPQALVFWDSNMVHELAEAILWGLNKWQDPHTSNGLPASQYLMDQESLGWDLFLDGWLVKSWQLHQAAVWQSTQSHWSSRQWVAELIKKLWNVSWPIVMVSCTSLPKPTMIFLRNKLMTKFTLSMPMVCKRC